MRHLGERMRVDPETGAPDPDLDVSDASGEASSLRRAIKQIKDSRGNLEKARDDTNDADRKTAYRAIMDELDKLHTALGPTYDALRRSGASVRIRNDREGSPTQHGGAGGLRRFLDPKTGEKQPAKGAQPRGSGAMGTDKQGSMSYGEARAYGRRLLREAQITLGSVKQEPWYPGFTTWTPRLDFAKQGDYGLGDASRGVVRAIADDARSPVHPREVAEMIAQAVSALYAEGRATDYPWFGHTTGMPDELGEGMIVTQEEVYWAIRKMSGDNAATPEYLDEVYKELEGQGLRVATKRPNTLERRRHTA